MQQKCTSSITGYDIEAAGISKEIVDSLEPIIHICVFSSSPLFPFLSPHGGSLPSHTSTYVDSHTRARKEEGR